MSYENKPKRLNQALVCISIMHYYMHLMKEISRMIFIIAWYVIVLRLNTIVV
jgi:hypothetical protein